MKSSLAFLTVCVLPPIVSFGLALLAAQTSWIQNIENLSLDMRTRFRARYQPSNDPRCAVVGIDDQSIEVIGRWPWPREFHAQFMNLTASAKPSVLAWDILFTEPDSSAPQQDMKLVAGAVVARSRGVEVIFGAVTNETPGPMAPNPVTRPLEAIEGDVTKVHGDAALLGPLPALQDRAHFALVDTPPGPDGARRVVPLVGRAGGRVYTSLSLEAVLRYWKVPPGDVRVRLGDAIYLRTRDGERRIPIDESGGYLINYRFGLETADAIGYAQLLTRLNAPVAGARPPGDLPDLAGRILLIGQVATALTDNGPTPFSGHTPLLLVHANVIDNILRGDFARRSPAVSVWIGSVLLGVAGLMACSNQKLLALIAFSLGIPILYAVSGTYTWIAGNLWLPIVWPILGFAGLQTFVILRKLRAEQRAKAQIKQMFGTYVSPELVNQMVESGESPRLGGQEVELTAYFSDIQEFSTFSEKLPPDKLVELMNEYLDTCTNIVQKERGTLDKYVGDAVVAMFGAPVALSDHAYRACVASQCVQQALEELRTKWRAEGEKWPPTVARMRSRIGLNTGMCIVGNIGGRTRFNYTMMGDNVNLAARMESGAKSWGAYTMCSEATKLACEQYGGDQVVFRPLGRIVVKGRSQPVPIFEVTGLKESVTASTRECLALFTQGLERYFERDWSGAQAIFKRAAGLEPNVPGKSLGVTTNPSLVYLRITDDYRLDPPPMDWNGVFVMKGK